MRKSVSSVIFCSAVVPDPSRRAGNRGRRAPALRAVENFPGRHAPPLTGATTRLSLQTAPRRVEHHALTAIGDSWISGKFCGYGAPVLSRRWAVQRGQPREGWAEDTFPRPFRPGILFCPAEVEGFPGRRTPLPAPRHSGNRGGCSLIWPSSIRKTKRTVRRCRRCRIGARPATAGRCVRDVPGRRRRGRSVARDYCRCEFTPRRRVPISPTGCPSAARELFD